MLLSAWRTSRLAYEFHRDSGRYARKLVRFGVHLPMSGLGAIESTREHGKLFFCLYRWEGQIHFQAGKRCWRLDEPQLRFEFRPLDGKSSQFSVYQGDEVMFRCTYGHWLRARLLRPEAGWDSVDFELDHFLAHVAGQPLPVKDLEAWEEGKPAPLAAGDDEPLPEP